MAKEDEGFIVINKKIRKWRYYHNPTARSLWLYILLETNWKNQYNRDGILVPRGSLLRSERTMAEESGLSRNTVRYWLKKFVESGEITIQKTTHQYSVINVVNYSKYQDYTQSNHPVNHPPTEPPTEPPTGPDRTKRTKRTKETREGTKGFVPPTLEEVIAFARSVGYPQHKAEKFFRYYSGTDWKAGKHRLTNWQEKLQEWKTEDDAQGSTKAHNSVGGRRGRVAQLPDYKQKPQEKLVDATSEDIEEFRELLKQHEEN